MSDVNNVVLTGRLTRDVQVRYTPNGTAVADGAVAVSGRNDSVTFVDLTFWGKNAEAAGEYLKKGKPVSVTGRLDTDQWEKDGQKRSKMKVTVESWNFVPYGSKPESDGEAKMQSQKQPEDEFGDGEDCPF